MNKHKNRHIRWVKGIAIGILCLFVSNILVTTGKSMFPGRGNPCTLAPKILLSDGQNRARLQASLICKLIEERASYGKSIEDIYLDDILLWTSSSEEAFEGCRFEALQHEIHIYLPVGNISIRYYDPTRADTIVPFSDITKLSTPTVKSFSFSITSYLSYMDLKAFNTLPLIFS